MQNVYAASEPNGMRQLLICIAVEIIDDLKYSRSAEPSKGFRVAVLSTLLCYVEREAY